MAHTIRCGFALQEDVVGNLFHIVLITIAFCVVLAGGKRLGWIAVVYMLLVVAGFFLFSLLFKWQIFGTRYHQSFFVLFAPLIGYAAARCLPSTLTCWRGADPERPGCSLSIPPIDPALSLREHLDLLAGVVFSNAVTAETLHELDQRINLQLFSVGICPVKTPISICSRHASDQDRMASQAIDSALRTARLLTLCGHLPDCLNEWRPAYRSCIILLTTSFKPQS
jgi:hypothetical protein